MTILTRRHLTYVQQALCVALLLSGCTMTPKPLTEDAIDDIAKDRLSRVVNDQEPISGPIDLYEAMARALKYNLDYKVEVMEQALRIKEQDLSQLDMLPKLVANAGYLSRSNDSGGRSLSILTGRESLEPSTSVEREHTTSDLTLSWDVLDFGLSYVRAKQRGDEVMLAMERRRKVANRIVEDVRTAYWRAVSSDRLLARLLDLEKSVDSALDDSQNLEQRGQTSPLKALTYQRELMSVKLQIKALHREFAVAKQQLAALMNIAPGTDYSLALSERPTEIKRLSLVPRDLVDMAFRARSELREIDYRMRINRREAKAALLQMLPSLRPYGGLNYDTNDLLYNEDWTAWGATVSWNLMNVFRYPRHKRQIEAQQVLLDQQALATAMAVMTQVHISLVRYQLSNDEFDSNTRYLDVQNKIDDKITAQLGAQRTSQQLWIRERMNTVVAELKSDMSYADLQNVYANIYASVGYDTFPAGVDGSESVAELSHALRDLWTQR